MGVSRVKCWHTNWARVFLFSFRPGLVVVSALIFASFLGLPGTSGAAPDTDRVVAELQKRYDAITTIEADFEQETTLRTIRQRRVAEGKVYLKKPGCMRWVYVKPERQEIVADGSALWIYSAAENRAYRYDARVYLESQLTMNFLLGRGDFRRDFVISRSPQSDNDKGRYHVLTFLPRQVHPQVREMTVWIDKETFLIQKISSQDHLGNETILSFKNQRMNRSLDKNMFAFAPPKGTEIIN